MIKLQKSAFYREAATRQALASFILSAQKFSMGEECEKFERTFAQKQGRKFAVLVNSGSSANSVLLQALVNLGRLKVQDAIGFSALTWATNIMPILQMGMRPIPVDCELTTLNVSPMTLGHALDATRLNALFLTHVLGFCDDIEKIMLMCRERGIILLEDTCESLGSRAYGRNLGAVGLASTFSFFVGHHLSTIEGGMICTDDEELRDMLVMVRAHGWDRQLPPARQRALRSAHGVDDFFALYTFYDVAYNMRPTEITGFLGNEQLAYLDEMTAKRAEHFRVFQSAVESNPDFIPLRVGHMETISNFAMPIVAKNEELTMKYRNRFLANGFEIRPIIAGDMTEQPFYKKYVHTTTRCPNAQIVHKNGFYFANNPELTADEVAFAAVQLSSTVVIPPAATVLSTDKPLLEKHSSIYVAGHTGMVGSAIVRALHAQGFTRIITRTRDELNLMDQRAVQEFFAQVHPQYVIVSAARVGGIKANMSHPAEFLYENSQIQNNIIWSAHMYGVKKLLFLGSSCIYPRGCPQPMKEEYFMDGKVEPTNEGYAVAKIAGMKLCEKIYEQYDQCFISCMPTNIYGVGDHFDLNSSHVIPALMRRMHDAKKNNVPEVVIWGSGQSRREFLYVDDLARAVVYLLEHYTDKQFINVGTGEDISIRELAEKIKNVVGYQGVLNFDTTKPDGMPRKLLDVGRLHGHGWHHEVLFDDGLAKTYQWMVEKYG